MSWQVYQAYVDPRLRDARGATELIAHTDPVPRSGDEYGEKYADKLITVPEPKIISLDTHMRRLLRFYNQVAMLVEKKLVDEDLILAFIGPGLKNSWPGIMAAIEWYQNSKMSSLGHAKDETIIYASIPRLYELYLTWEAKHERAFLI